MLTVRMCQLLAVGACLFLITQYMRFIHASIRGLDRLMSRSFFDVDELTTEIRDRMEVDSDDAPVQEPLGGRACRLAYLWLCQRLRRAVGLDSRAD